MEEIVFIHGKTNAKIINRTSTGAMVEYLEDSKRHKAGIKKWIGNVNLRLIQQRFGKKNHLMN